MDVEFKPLSARNWIQIGPGLSLSFFYFPFLLKTLLTLVRKTASKTARVIPALKSHMSIAGRLHRRRDSCHLSSPNHVWSSVLTFPRLISPARPTTCPPLLVITFYKQTVWSVQIENHVQLALGLKRIRLRAESRCFAFGRSGRGDPFRNQLYFGFHYQGQP